MNSEPFKAKMSIYSSTELNPVSQLFLLVLSLLFFAKDKANHLASSFWLWIIESELFALAAMILAFSILLLGISKIEKTQRIAIFASLQANYWVMKYQESDKTDLSLFNKILVLWIAQERIEWHISLHLLTKGIEKKQSGMVSRFTNYAERIIKNQSCLIHHLALTKAYQALHDEENAQRISLKTTSLFPKTTINVKK